MNDIRVDWALVEKIRRIRGRTFDHTGVSREWDITELFKRMLNMSEDELTVAVIAALQKCPDRVYKALADDREELVRKGRKNEVS